MSGRPATSGSDDVSGYETTRAYTDPIDVCRWDSEAFASVAGEIIVLRIDGEVDAFTLPVVQSAIAESLRRRPVDLVVDLAGLSFCCARGLDLLVTTERTAARYGVGYAVSGLSSHLSHIWTLLWNDEFPAYYPTAAVAVTTIQTQRAGPERLDAARMRTIE